MKYGNLEYIGESGTNQHQKKLWLMRCDCGVECTAIATTVRTGRKKSCGCLKLAGNRKTHGHRVKEGKQTRAYTAWVNMKRRCTAKTLKQYQDYGGRGITYDDRWELFENFFVDMGIPGEGLTLDRANNDLGYSKANCRWASKKEQALNTRQNRYVEHCGETKTVKEWSDCLGLKYGTLLSRLNRGMPINEALSGDLKSRWGRIKDDV